MIQVGLLTLSQKEELTGQLYDSDSYFNPIQDINDNWIISVEEIDQNENQLLSWVKDLPLIPFEPKQSPPPIF
jgi:hypothetical protein